MKKTSITQQIFRPWVAGVLWAAVALPAGAVELKTPDGAWTFSLNGNVNVDYIYSSCENPSTPAIAGGFTCRGTTSSSSVSNIGNGLLPAAFSFGVSTTQGGYDLAAHLGLYPGIATNDGGSPNLQANSANGSSNTALGTTGLDVRQVYMTFGNKELGTFTLGRQIGLFGADAILNDMTLPGVGAPGSAASAAPSNTTLGGIGFGYIYTDWLGQIDYTTPDVSGFNLTLGVFDPINSLTEPGGATVQPKKAPGFHAKGTYTAPLSGGTKLYVSVAFLTQEQDYVLGGTAYNYRGNGIDLFAKLDLPQNLELIGYYYHATGLGTTALFLLGANGLGNTRDSDGYLAQVTYKAGDAKLGVNYGDSHLKTANAADNNPALVAHNKKVTAGVYYSLTKNLTLLAEVSRTKSEPQSGASNEATTVNAGAFLGF